MELSIFTGFSSDIAFLIFIVLQLDLELKTVNKIMIRNSLSLFIFTTIFVFCTHSTIDIIIVLYLFWCVCGGGGGGGEEGASNLIIIMCRSCTKYEGCLCSVKWQHDLYI